MIKHSLFSHTLLVALFLLVMYLKCCNGIKFSDHHAVECTTVLLRTVTELSETEMSGLVLGAVKENDQTKNSVQF